MSPAFDLFQEMEKIVSAFNAGTIRYAVAGGFAVALYGFVRATKDMDFLCHPDDVPGAGAALADLGYKQYADTWTFRE